MGCCWHLVSPLRALRAAIHSPRHRHHAADGGSRKGRLMHTHALPASDLGPLVCGHDGSASRIKCDQTSAAGHLEHLGNP